MLGCGLCPSKVVSVSQSVLLFPPAVVPEGLQTKGFLHQLQYKGEHTVVQEVEKL